MFNHSTTSHLGFPKRSITFICCAASVFCACGHDQPRFEVEVVTSQHDDGMSSVTVRFFSEECERCDEPSLAAVGTCHETTDSMPECGCDPEPWSCVESMRVVRRDQKPVEKELDPWWGRDWIRVKGELTEGSELVLLGCDRELHVPLERAFPAAPKDIALDYRDPKDHVGVNWSGTTDADLIEVAVGDGFDGVSCNVSGSTSSATFGLHACGVELAVVVANSEPVRFLTPFGGGRRWAETETLLSVERPDSCYPANAINDEQIDGGTEGMSSQVVTTDGGTEPTALDSGASPADASSE